MTVQPQPKEYIISDSDRNYILCHPEDMRTICGIMSYARPHTARAPEAAIAFQAGIECGKEEAAIDAAAIRKDERNKTLDALERNCKGRKVEDAIAEIRRFPDSLRQSKGDGQE